MNSPVKNSLILSVLTLLCPNAFGQPHTEASVSLTDYQLFPYSQSDPHYASGSGNGDTSSSFSIWSETAHAASTFGFNSAYAASTYAYISETQGYGSGIAGTPPSQEQQAASSSYRLNWSTADNSLSGTILSLDLGLGDSRSGQLSGVFSFLYGTPYNIQSLLAVNAANRNTTAAASSIWADTITFQGQPDGTAGSATFTVSLSGSISEAHSQFTRVWLVPTLSTIYDESIFVADFSGGAVLSGIELPDGAAIAAASGFVYPVPEPGTLSLLGLGLGGLWLHRPKRKPRAACQTWDSESRSRLSCC